MLFSIVKHPEITANDLNHDIDVIHQWAHQWKLEFNPDPTKQDTEVLFSCKTSTRFFYKKHEAENWPKNKKHFRNMARLKFRKHKKWKKHEILTLYKTN